MWEGRGEGAIHQSEYIKHGFCERLRWKCTKNCFEKLLQKTYVILTELSLAICSVVTNNKLRVFKLKKRFLVSTLIFPMKYIFLLSYLIKANKNKHKVPAWSWRLTSFSTEKCFLVLLTVHKNEQENYV